MLPVILGKKHTKGDKEGTCTPFIGSFFTLQQQKSVEALKWFREAEGALASWEYIVYTEIQLLYFCSHSPSEVLK